MYGYRQKLEHDICISLLFINKSTGYDTTSQFCTIGKGTVFEAMIQKLHQYVEMYMSSSVTHKVIEKVCKRGLFSVQQEGRTNNFQIKEGNFWEEDQHY